MKKQSLLKVFFNGILNETLSEFGNIRVINQDILKTDIGEIRIFSRDEKKQDDMRHEFQTKMPEVAEKIKFYRDMIP